MLKRFKFDEERARAVALIDIEIEKQSRKLGDDYGENDEATIEERISHIESLVTIRNELKHEGKMMKGLDPTVIASGTIGILGILLMLNFERDDIISTKALPSIGKWFGM